ncbi:hypothetical protein ACT1U9_30515 [Streptomyces sp. BR1]|uniref:hypothetical protein n=1 Tax=Streptomyces sp. BR1 TaxID=1592323 RepID=UPI00402B758E
MNVGVLLRGVDTDTVARGQVLAAPGSIGEHAIFTTDITLLAEEHGGAEVASGDRLHFYTGTASVTGTVTHSAPTSGPPPASGARWCRTVFRCEETADVRDRVPL